MKLLHPVCLFAVVVFAAAPARSQEPEKPSPEHEVLKKMEGTWDVTMKAGGTDMKGTATYKMELGGLWLASTFEVDLFGTKFQGKGLDTYDAKKKKYTSIWADNMSSTPMLMEGTYDKEKKAQTMTGEGPGMDGKPAKWKSVSEFTDADTITFNMFVGDAKEPMFTNTYKRKK